jgi:asparagine synthase (glutamine-hydrolysing)
MYLLARAVRANAITVVATGEGADELFWGYELFKEVALRELAEQDPERASELLDGLYDYLGPAAARRGPAWKRFILETGAGDDPLGSHLTRAGATSAVKSFLRPEIAEQVAPGAALDRLRGQLPAASASWSRLERASWLEVTTLLEPYLLSAQGDRVAMGNGVEGRYPFLDHRVFDCASRLSRPMKLNGMRDKAILRDLGDRLLPASIAGRAKQPYRAPGIAPFFTAQAPSWVEELVAPDALESSGLWDPTRVEGLLKRCRSGRATGPREEMAFVGILSAQLWHQAFMDKARRWPEETAQPQVRIDRMSPTQQGVES